MFNKNIYIEDSKLQELIIHNVGNKTLGDDLIFYLNIFWLLLNPKRIIVFTTIRLYH